VRDGTIGDNPEIMNQIVFRCLDRIQGMRKMIGDLLDLTRIESGQKRREMERVDAGDMAERAIETLLPDAQARSIAIELHKNGDLALWADKGELEIILNNLVSNAVKYNKDNGRVDVLLSRDGEFLTIAVKDTGIGMTRDEAAKLFNDFVRIKNSSTSGILGSGLGLSIVKKLAMLYEGKVKVESEPGEGSTFTVTLKDTAPQQAPTEALAADPHPASDAP